MNKIIVPILTLSLLFFSCKEKKQAQYFLKNRWKVKILPYATLKSNPKKVIEFFYRGIEDINLNPLPTHGSYESFKYNDSGDVVEYTFHLSAQKTFTITSKYNVNGYSQFMNDQSTQGFEEKLYIDFQPDEQETFKETTWPAEGGMMVRQVRFAMGGNEISKRSEKTDTVEKKPFITETLTTLFYNGQKPLRQKVITTTGNDRVTSEKKFNYNFFGHLESIVSTFAGTTNTTYFKNNEHGDPVEQLEIENKYTLINYQRSYIYDQKGNWIRMLEKETKGPKTPANSSSYILISREIFY